MHILILVTQSPRRKNILAKAGYKFRSDHIKVSEIIDENLNPDEVVRGLAQLKSEAYRRQHKPLKSQKILVVTADTLVVFGSKVLGKPKDSAQAFEFLSILSGKTHCVKTAVNVYDFDKCQSHTFLETTEVDFNILSEEEILNYIATGEPFDKAGAYAIQGEGRKFVKSYRGSWFNVVGFPLELFEKQADLNGWKIDREQPTTN